MIRRVFAVSVLFLAVFFSCSTVQFVQKERTALKVIDLINEGDAEGLTRISGSPFLLDGEIIMMPGDMKQFWEKAAEKGFVLSNPEVIGITPVDGNTYNLFSPYEEVKVFFEKYVPSDAAVARVSSPAGDVLLLLYGKNKGYPYILGFKGM